MSWDYFILGLYLVGALMGFGIACDISRDTPGCDPAALAFHA